MRKGFTRRLFVSPFLLHVHLPGLPFSLFSFPFSIPTVYRLRTRERSRTTPCFHSLRTMCTTHPNTSFHDNNTNTIIISSTSNHNGNDGGDAIISTTSSDPTSSPSSESLWKPPLPTRLPSTCYTVDVARGSGPGGQGVNSSSNKVIVHVKMDFLTSYLSDHLTPCIRRRMINAMHEAAGRGGGGNVAVDGGGGATAERHSRKSRKQRRKALCYQLRQEQQPLQLKQSNNVDHHPQEPTPLPPPPLGSIHFRCHAHRSRAANEEACVKAALALLKSIEHRVLSCVQREKAIREEQGRQERQQWRIQRPRASNQALGEKSGENERSRMMRMVKSINNSHKCHTEENGEEEETRGDEAEYRRNEEEGEEERKDGPPFMHSRGHYCCGCHTNRHREGSTIRSTATTTTTTNSLQSRSRNTKDDFLSSDSSSSSASSSSCQLSSNDDCTATPPRAQPSFFFSNSFSSYLTKRKNRRRTKGVIRAAQRTARAGKW